MTKLEHERPKHETVMDVTEEQLARVYAQAFLGAISTSSNAAGLVEELESVVSDVLGKFPALGEMFRSAFVSPEDKQKTLDRILGGRASVEVLNFLKVLAARERLMIVASIARNVRKLYDEGIGVTAVEVHVAHELSDELRQQIQDQLSKTLGKKPSLRVTVNPELIGGILVRVGDQVYDGSVSTQLQHARKHMIDTAVEQIVTRPERFTTTT